jgi:hypothetical protein
MLPPSQHVMRLPPPLQPQGPLLPPAQGLGDSKLSKRDQHKKLTKLNGKINALEQEVKDLKAEMVALRKEREALQRRCDTSSNTVNLLDIQNHSLRQENQKKDLRFRDFSAAKSKEINILIEKNEQEIRELTAQKNQEIRKLAEEKDHQIRELTRTKIDQSGEIHTLQGDVNRLRTLFYSMTTGSSSIRGEDYYLQTFEEVRSEFENWIARNAKSGSRQALSDHDVRQIISTVSKLGGVGKESCEMFTSKRGILLTSTDTWERIVFIRHIVSVFLFVGIFEPMVFGLVPEISKALLWMENDIMAQGDEPSGVY